MKGIRSTLLEIKSNGIIHINNILYVLGLKKILLSISCLEDKGDGIYFVDGKVLVLGNGSSIEHAKIIGIRERTLYWLLTSLPQYLIHLDVIPSKLWNIKYVHLHYNIFPSLNQIVIGIPKLKEDRQGIYKGFALGKNVKKPFARKGTRSKEILDLKHSNMCGPMAIKSLGGHQYMWLFIDDFSRKPWLYLPNAEKGN